MNFNRERETERLDAIDRLTVLLESQEQALGAIHATRAMTLAALFEVSGTRGQLVGEDAEMMLRSVAAEAASVVRISDRTMQRRLWEAWELVHHFPATFTSLAAGKISLAHVVEIQKAAVNLDEHGRAEFEARAVPLAEAESVSRLRNKLSAVAEDVRPVSMTERHREARKDRSVFVRDLPDGMGELVAILPAVLAQGCMDRLTTIAKDIQDARADASAGCLTGIDDLLGEAPAVDDRTLDQTRADVFADLLLAGTNLAHGDALGAIRGQVQVTIPVHTLAGVTETGATMAGWGAVDADSIRTLAGTAAGWDRVMTDEVTGTVVAVDRYRPSSAIIRTLRVRDEHCRFPGCRQAASRCDIDHTHDAAYGGETSIDNLAHLCRRHHTLKHQSQWKVKQLGGGLLEWQSPTGRTYIDTPIHTVTFTDSTPGGPEADPAKPKRTPPPTHRGEEPPPLPEAPPW